MKRGFSAKEQGLRNTELIKEVFDKGIPLRARLTTVFLLKRASGPMVNRAAFLVTRRLHSGKAVLRNRLKRVIKEAYITVKHILPLSHDIIILAVNIKKKTKSTDVSKELADVFKKYTKKHH